MTYLGNRGIFSLSPSIIGVNAEINPGRGMIVNVAKDKVESILKSITHPEKAVAEFYSKEGLYLLSYCDDGSGINNRILALDQQGAFLRWTGIQANDICHRLDGELLFASTNYLLRRKDWYWDALPSGQYVGIPAVMETPKYSLGIPMHRKLLTKYQAAIQGQLGNYEVTIKVKVDDQVVANTTLGSGLSKPLTLIRKQIRATGNRFFDGIVKFANQHAIHGLRRGIRGEGRSVLWEEGVSVSRKIRFVGRFSDPQIEMQIVEIVKVAQGLIDDTVRGNRKHR